MTRFYGIVDGDRGHTNSHRTGSRWLNTFTNGWDIGVQVHVHKGYEQQPDYFDIYITGGSNDNTFKKLLVSLTVKEMDTLLKQKKDISFMDLYLSQGKVQGRL
jgi:hypothetical protein